MDLTLVVHCQTTSFNSIPNFPAIQSKAKSCDCYYSKTYSEYYNRNPQLECVGHSINVISAICLSYCTCRNFEVYKFSCKTSKTELILHSDHYF